MAGHALRDLDAPAVRQVVRDPGRAERVTAYRGFDAGVRSAAAHHVPDILARHPPRPELFGFPDRDAEQRPLGIAGDAGLGDVGVQVGFQLVMAGHLMHLAVFLVEAEPPALFLGEIIHDVQRHDRAHAREGVGHHRGDGAIAQAHHA